MFFSKSTGGFYDNAIHGNAIPADAVEISTEEHASLLAGQASGKRIVADAAGRPKLQYPPPPTQAEMISRYEQALDAHLDGVAQQQRFKDRHSLALRAGYASPYQKLASAYASWMDGCNVQAYQLLQDVQAGKKPQPTVEAFLATLPVFVAPDA